MFFLFVFQLALVLGEIPEINERDSVSRHLDPPYCNIYWGYYLNGTQCLPCDQACGSCTGPTAFDCIQCSGLYVKILGICLENCPLGYTQNGNVCQNLTSNGLVYNLDLTLIQNNIEETVKVGASVIAITAGSSSLFYPTYDPFDPYAISQRGFYFDGDAYFINDDYLLVFAPTFTIGTWLKPMTSSGYIFAKQYNEISYVSLYINNYNPTVALFITTSQSFTSPNKLTGNAWNFVMVKVLLVGKYAQISITTNTLEVISSNLNSFYTDLFQQFTVTTGAKITSGSYSNFYTGYMWSFTVYNTNVSLSSFIQTSGCSGCSICPLNNSNQCIPSCTYQEYIANGTCINCTAGCQKFGCVRNDKKCNLCYDQKCLNCDTFLLGCSQCITNAYLVGSSCICDYNYIWDDYLEACRPCSASCQTCNGGGYLGCSLCKPGFYMIWGLCVNYCPTGYSISDSSCVLTGSSNILNLKLNTISGVIYDSASGIPVIAGHSAIFYPFYEADDPIAAYGRGYYFNGYSIMHFAPYSSYLTPFLSFAPVCNIGVWINPSYSTGIIFSDASPSLNYSIIMEIGIASYHPYIVLALSQSSSSDIQIYPRYTSLQSVNQNAWNYVVFSIYLSNHEQTFITCYVNQLADPQYLLGQGHFTDVTTCNNMLLGTLQEGSSTTSSFYYKGFIYQVFVNLNTSNPYVELTTSCGNAYCSYCPIGGICLSNCGILQYPANANPNNCTSCNSNCSSTSCRNSDHTCNLCEDSTCEVCTDYIGNCTLYQCANGLFKVAGMANCAACDPSCANCSNVGPSACTGCSNGNYLLEGTCHSFCPTGYTASGSSCVLALSQIVNLNLQNILAIVNDSQSGFQSLSGNSIQFYPFFEVYDPWPTQNRGYYFHDQSFLNFPPNSIDSKLLTLGNQFTFSMWINSTSDGIIFSKVNSTFYPYLLIKISTHVSISILLNKTQYNVSTALSLSSNWNFVGISIKYLSNSTSSVTFYINNNTQTMIIGNGYYNDIINNFNITIGAIQTINGYSDYWNGALYMFKIYSQGLAPNDYSTICDKSSFSCTICPSTTNACLETCNHGSWWDGFGCNQCDACDYNSCVRQDKSCNLCYDVQCEVCSTFNNGSCSECKANATLNSGVCTCKTNYYWNNIDEACEFCNPWYKVISQGVCLNNCPTGYTNTSGICTGTPGKIFEILLDGIIIGTVVDTIGGIIKVQTGISSSFYPNYDLTDPYAGKNRGYYFNGYSSYMIFLVNSNNNYQLVLSSEFSIGFWVYPVHYGVIFSRQSSANLGLLIELTSNYNVKVTVLLSSASSITNYTSIHSVTLSKWNYIGVTFSMLKDTSTRIIIVINNITENARIIGKTPFIDFQSSYTCIIGATYNSTFILNTYYTGYIRSISVWNTDYSLKNQVSTSCSGNCIFCPLTGSCLTNCALTSFYLNACQDCSNSCNAGCVRSQDCNLCYDRLCYICTDYTSTGCSKCVDGASLVSGSCKCNNGNALIASNGNLYCSTTCMSYCATCLYSTNGNCLSCNSGYYLYPTGLCVSSCPTGYQTQSNLCVASNQHSAVLHYVFNKTINDPPDLTARLLAFMGSTINYAGNFDINDPIPIYGRGIYFSGNSKYVNLPPNQAEVRSVILGNAHSIQIWLRPTGYSSGCIIVKESNLQKYLYVYIDSSLTTQAWYQVFNILDASSSNFQTSGPRLSLNTWKQLSIIFQRSGQATIATIYVNGIPGPTGIGPTSFFIDQPTYLFKLGYSTLASTSYQGYIYELIIYNFAINPIAPSSCACGICIALGDCLSSCNISQYIASDNTCNSCSGQCTNGCISGDSCSSNKDPLCLNYTGPEINQCTGCVALAKQNSSGCFCSPNTQTNSGSCSCINLYEIYQDTCIPCYYYIQDSDLTSYFSSDFLSVIFAFNQALQPTISSNCNILFTSNSSALLGLDPICQWNSNFTMLTVILGTNPNVNNQTITFNSDILFTNSQVCGSNINEVSTLIFYKYLFPVIIPNAVILAPFNYYLFCGDLEIDSSKSTGGYHRPLKIKWTIESSPGLSIFNDTSLLNQTILNFANTSLSPSAVNVTLTVSNWLGYQDSTWQVIEIISGIGISLALDSNIKWHLTSEMSKSIYVQPQSECALSSHLEYTWSVNSYSGPDAYVNTAILWTSQTVPSILYIPAGSLGPGTYIFLLVVTDTVYSLSGQTELKITVDYSDLLVDFNPSYLTVSANQEFVLDGTSAIDPDHTREIMTYSWSCLNGTMNCTNIISDTTIQSPIIQANFMQDNCTYNFNLMIKKGNRYAVGSLTVSIISNSAAQVTFNPLPLYINNQENFVIKPNLNIECNCTFNWKLVYGPKIQFTSGTTSKDLGIVPYSMEPGSVYGVELDINDNNQVSVFRESFIVDIPPTGGNFYSNATYGFEQTTVFMLEAPNWYDPKNKDNPLTYQFGYYINDHRYFLNIRNESYTFCTVLPQGNPLILFVKIYDIYNSYTEWNLTILVNPSTIDPHQLIEQLGGLISVTWTDPSILPAYVNSLAIYMLNHTDN